MAKKSILRSIRTWLSNSQRYLKGAESVPGALECLIEYVSDRPTLDIESWSEQAGKSAITPEVAHFVFEFFSSHEVPISQVRLNDRLEADLHLTRVLPQEWGDEFQEAFMDRFGASKLFEPGLAPDTIGDLLSFVQQELDDWRASTRK